MRDFLKTVKFNAFYIVQAELWFLIHIIYYISFLEEFIHFLRISIGGFVMIIDISIIRKKSNHMINDIVFEYKMASLKNHKNNMKLVLPAVGFSFILQKPGHEGIYSYEMMNHARATGDYLNAWIFGLLPVLQGIDVNNIKMMNTYIKDKIPV
jgi:hypothetical protein